MNFPSISSSSIIGMAAKLHRCWRCWFQQLGRTVPSFRIVLAEEKAEWKPFHNAFDKKERKEFDDMWDIPKLYISACSNSVQLVPLQPIVISILFHHYKELKECLSGVEQIEANVNNKRIQSLPEKEEERVDKKPSIKQICMTNWIDWNRLTNNIEFFLVHT